MDVGLNTVVVPSVAALVLITGGACADRHGQQAERDQLGVQQPNAAEEEIGALPAYEPDRGMPADGGPATEPGERREWHALWCHSPLTFEQDAQAAPPPGQGAPLGDSGYRCDDVAREIISATWIKR